MEITKTGIDGLYVLSPAVHGDNRGWFYESYSALTMKQAGLEFDFVQDNHSMSSVKGTLRGIHFQLAPKAQTKLVRCTRGEVLDVAVDLRRDSETYKKWFSVRLSEENKKQLLIPKGFGHGFLTLTENSELQYKVDEFYSREHDRSIRFDDPDIGIDWGTYTPILSQKDMEAPFLGESDIMF